MVYAKGHEEDEKLHRSFHSGAVQGLKFQVCKAATYNSSHLEDADIIANIL
jgi:hypothetical protein